jgi:cyclopropane fatty-acyl-phospholipid synthase-like methyltransferase
MPQALVRDGYDRIADRYLEWSSGELSPGRRHALATIRAMVTEGASVLDLGCGAGVPMTAALAAQYRVHGIDISRKQIELARRSVPEATFEQADITNFVAQPESYDAVVAFYSLTHLPRAGLSKLMCNILGWLRPEGVFVASLGAADEPGVVEPEWLGAPMYFSHFDVETNISTLRGAGFKVESAEIIADPEDDSHVDFLWVVASRS